MLRFTEPKSAALFVVAAVSLSSLCFSSIGAEWNPTGNPIGGGPGYSDSVRHQNADYYVTTRTQLLSALATAGSGDVIYIGDAANMDLTGESYLNVPSGVTLASGRGRTLGDTISWGALLYTNELSAVNPLFQTGGVNVRITGLRLKGAFSFLDHRPGTDSCDSHIYQRAINARHDCEIDNCEIWGWNDSGINVIWQAHAYIHHNYIHHNDYSGMGYGIVCASSEPNWSIATVEANLVDYCSHFIASSTDTTAKYVARWNILLEHGRGHSLDNHAKFWDYGPCAPLEVYNNTIRHAAPVRSNVPGFCQRGTTFPPTFDSILVYQNWFYASDSASSINLYSENYTRVSSNHFGKVPLASVHEKIPTAVANVDTDSSSVPLSVNFTNAGSSDLDGSIKWYEWNFGDHQYVRYSSNTHPASISHTYDEIGVYNAQLTVYDDDGIPDRSDLVRIQVDHVDPDSIYFSAWVYDRWPLAINGQCYKQVIIDNDTIWEQDLAGDEGWVHISENVTSSVIGKDSVTIKLRVVAKGAVSGEAKKIMVFWEDVGLSGANVLNGNFETYDDDGIMYSTETDGHWTYSESGSWIGQYHGGFALTGEMCYGYYCTSSNCSQGSWAMIRQKVPVTAVGIHNPMEDENDTKSYLCPPYPNPAKTMSCIEYRLPGNTNVSMKIFDISGRLVKILFNGDQQSGKYSVVWDGKDIRGGDVNNGVFFCRLVVDDYEETRQIVWLR